MARAAGNQFANMMDRDQSFVTILASFGITQRATNRLTEYYVTSNDLMASNVEQIKSVVNHKNNMYRSHATALHRCYINTAQLNRIFAFYNWTVYAIKDAHAEYDENNSAAFDLTWINSIIDSYNMKDPDDKPQSTAFSVIILTFDGTNWHDVKAKVIALLTTCVGTSRIPLNYLIRETRQTWEDTEQIPNLQERRIATKVHKSHTFEPDNRELFRILLNTFTSTTLDNVVRSFQKHNNGMEAWKAIIANLEGAKVCILLNLTTENFSGSC